MAIVKYRVKDDSMEADQPERERENERKMKVRGLYRKEAKRPTARKASRSGR